MIHCVFSRYGWNIRFLSRAGKFLPRRRTGMLQHADWRDLYRDLVDGGVGTVEINKHGSINPEREEYQKPDLTTTYMLVQGF
jgi:hypothetical protein